MPSVQNVFVFVSVLLSGLIAGLLYGYACSVNPGLHKLGDSEYIKAMQSINKAIVNPVFFISFMGTLLVLPAAAWYSRSNATPACFYLLLAAALIYIGGVFGVTAFGNIPLNNALAEFDVNHADTAGILQQRLAFEAKWNTFHMVRTVCSVITTMLTIAAAMQR